MAEDRKVNLNDEPSPGGLVAIVMEQLLAMERAPQLPSHGQMGLDTHTHLLTSWLF